MKRLILAGNSHLRAMGVPLVTEDRMNAIVDAPFASGKIAAATGEWPRTGNYWQFVLESCSNDVVALMWKGNQHLSSFLFEDAKPFDFIVSGSKDFPILQGSTIVPLRAIEAHLEEGMDQLGSICKKLKKAGNHVIVCAPPPPKGDDDFIRRVLGSEKHFVALAQKSGQDSSNVRLTSRHVRYKLWLTLSRLYEELAETYGAVFFAAPSDAQDEDGFLERRFWANDVSHANDAYGELYLKKLYDFAARSMERVS